jgi:hypothetical protein
MKWPGRTAAAASVVLALGCPAWGGQVRLEIHDGKVTLNAKDATVRDILIEWSRVGHTEIINAERVPAAPVTLELNGVPERDALETVLRSSAGFVAAQRAVPESTASVFDRILVMPGSRPDVVATTTAAATTSPAPPPGRRPFFQQRPAPPPAVDDQDEPLPTASMPLPGAPTPGAAQPGTMTPGQPVNPSGGAGTNLMQPPGQVPQPNAPPQAPSPYTSPSGAPYGAGQAPAPGATQQQAPPPTPNSAPRPGMPTQPIKDPVIR